MGLPHFVAAQICPRDLCFYFVENLALQADDQDKLCSHFNFQDAFRKLVEHVASEFVESLKKIAKFSVDKIF